MTVILVALAFISGCAATGVDAIALPLRRSFPPHPVPLPQGEYLLTVVELVVLRRWSLDVFRVHWRASQAPSDAG